MELRRKFTPIGLLILSINGMIGSAWLFAPLYSAKIAGSAAIIAWLIGGAMTATIALTFAELSVLLPVAGGSARIPEFSHGALTSFSMSWIAWLSSITMPPIEIQAVLQYASTYFSGLTHIVNGTPLLTTIGMIWAAILMFGLFILNVVSFKGLIRSNFLIFTFKVLVILLTITWLIKTSFHSVNFDGTISNIANFEHWHMILAAVATGGIAFAFTGFKHGVELAGEANHLRLSIPLAIVGSVVCCLLLYIGLQVAFIGALNPNQLAQGWSNLNFAGDVGPFAGLAMALGLVWLLKLLYIDAIVSPLGAGLIYATSTARIMYAMSQSGYFPRWLSQLNSKGLPVYSVGINCLLGMLLFLPFPGWQAMVSFLVSAMVISYSMGPIALLSLRLELPNQERGFRLPLAKFACVLAFYCCNLISYWTGWDTISKLDVAVVLGMGFFVYAYWQGRIDHEHLGLKSIVWLGPYLTGLSIISYLGSFGGKNIIPFGWDFLILAIFSVSILCLAVRQRVHFHEHVAADLQKDFIAAKT